MSAIKHQGLTQVENTIRELTREERAAIKNLNVSMCANYDREYGCLPLDYGRCYMLDKWQTGAFCKHFLNAVLPLDPVLAASLTGREAPEQDVCAACGKPFVAGKQQLYCSPACQRAGNRRRSRERMRKKRQKGRV
jgi:hypothetical protein